MNIDKIPYNKVRNPYLSKDNNYTFDLVIFAGIFILLLAILIFIKESNHIGSADAHGMLEMVGSMFGVITGFTLISKFYILGNRFHLMVGIAFMVNGIEDFIHGFLGFGSIRWFSNFDVDMTIFIPDTYVTGRFLMSLLLIIACFIPKVRMASVNFKKETIYSTIIAAIGTVVITIFAFIVELPTSTYPELYFSRPIDLATSFLFLVALIGLLKVKKEENDELIFWFIISIIFHCTGQYIMSFSKELYDINFDVAHVYKVIGYSIPLIGVALSQAKGIDKLMVTEQNLQYEIDEKEIAQKLLLQTKNIAVQNEERLKAIIDKILDSIIVINENKIIESVNPATEKLFGYKPKELIGQNVKIIVPISHRAQHDQYVDNYLKTGIEKIIGFNRELTGLKKDGSEFPIELGVSKIKLEDGFRFIGLIKDISERHHANNLLAEEKERLAESLEQIELQNQELGIINEELRSLDVLKTNFVSAVSHELRTPLTSIKGSIGLLLAGSVGEFNEQSKQFLDISYRNTDRLIRLINDILDISKMNDNTSKLKLSNFDLSEVIDDAYNGLKAIADEQNIDFKFAELKDLKVFADKDKIAQIMFNLLSNAFKFSKDGKVSINVDQTDDIIEVSVIDSGTGIPHEMIDKIFEQFVQVDSSIKKKYGGTGLGLTICKSIIEMHGGAIWVESKVDVGSTFKFILPKAHNYEDDILAKSIND